MIYFNNDYSEGCHETVLEALTRTNLEQTPGYGEDAYCAKAAAKIRALCQNETVDVHFLMGGTQIGDDRDGGLDNAPEGTHLARLTDTCLKHTHLGVLADEPYRERHTDLRVVATRAARDTELRR